MGVRNLSLLMSALGCNARDTIQPFDCVLIDIQSIIYSKLALTSRLLEQDILDDVAEKTFEWFVSLLQWILQYCEKELVVFVAFDGLSVPMKLPLQKKRRCNINFDENIKVIQSAIFGCNAVSMHVYKYLCEQLCRGDTGPYYNNVLPPCIKFYLSSCQVPGEGEHKLFHFCSTNGYRKPLIVSVDNDVFLIALARHNQYDRVQLVKKINQKPKIYDLNKSCVSNLLLYTSFLFGNDFIPEVIQISPSNIPTLVNALEQHKRKSSLPKLLYVIIQQHLREGKIKFIRADYFPDELVVEFWKNCLWIIDYYTKDEFPQKYMTNRLANVFDRNWLLTAFENFNYVKRMYKRAEQEYMSISTECDIDRHHSFVFSTEQMEKLKHYLYLSPTPNPQLLEIVWRFQ